jgi:hypothetical protein
MLAGPLPNRSRAAWCHALPLVLPNAAPGLPANPEVGALHKVGDVLVAKE